MAVELDVFLSHNSSDKPAVEEIGRRLEREGIRCWLDKWNLVPGEPWQEAIEEALERSGACAVFLGPSGIGPWANEEMRVALTRRVAERRSSPGGRQGFRVIPVLLPGAPADVEVPPFLGRLTWVRFGSSLDDKDAFHRLIRGIRGMAPGARAEVDSVLEAPYRGLEVFDVNHAPLFFGREEWIERLLRKVEESKRRFLAIVGPSGSGKSSLARAGALAALQQDRIEGSSDWLQVICRPGTEPLLNLALALNRERSGADSYLGVRSLARDLIDDPSSLHVAVRLALREAPEGSRLVLLIDQFEEIFTNRVEEEERRALLNSLYHAATVKDGPTLVIITLRAEFYGQFADHPIAELLSEHHVLLGPMTPDEFRRAIEMPALRAGCELEPGLTDLLLRDVEGQPGSLPLLQYALLELWEQRRGRRLVVETYRDIGGVAGALRRRAEQVQETFSAEEREVICRRLLLLLAQPDEREGYSRRRARRDEVLAVVGDHAQAETVLNKLADARLVVTESTEGESFVEIAHEALIREWPRLRGWIDERREEILLRFELGEAAERWGDRGKDFSYLFTGARLAAAEAWARSGEMGLGTIERDFLEASLAAQQEAYRRELEQAEALRREQERRKNEERRHRKLLIVAICLIMMVALLAASWIYEQRRVKTQEALAQARDLSAKSGIALSSFPLRGLLLAREAVRIAEQVGQPRFAPSEEALRRALALSWGYPLREAGRSWAAISSDQKILATMNLDGVVLIWDTNQLTSASKPVARLSGSRIPLREMVFSPDTRWLAAVYQDSTVDVWNLRKLSSPHPAKTRLPGPPDSVFRSEGSVVFSPDGEWIAASSGHTGPIHVWKPEAPQEVRQIGTQNEIIQAADIGYDNLLAVSYRSGQLEIWNVAEVTKRSLPPLEPMPFYSLAWRRTESNGQWLLAADTNGPMIAWDSRRELTKRTRLGHCPNKDFTQFGRSLSLTLSPRSRWLAYSTDANLCVFDLRTPAAAPIIQFPDPRAVVFRNDDSYMAVADRKSVFYWDLNSQTLRPFRALELAREDDQLTTLILDSTALQIAAFTDRVIQVFRHNDSGGTSISGFQPTHDGPLSIVGYSADHRWLITNSPQDVPRIWDLSISKSSPEPLALYPEYRLFGRLDAPKQGGRWLLSEWGLFDLDSSRFGFFRPHLGPIGYTATLSPDGEWIAALDRRELLVSKLKPGSSPRSEPTFRLPHNEISTPLVFDRTATRLAVAGPGTIKIRDMNNPQRILDEIPQDAVSAMAFSPDDRWLAAVGNDLRLWDLTDKRPRAFRLEDSIERIPLTLLFSPPPGQWLAVLSPGKETLNLYSLAQPIPEKVESWNAVSAVAFSEDGRNLSIADNESIWIIDLSNLTAVPKTFVGHLGKIRALAFSPDHQWLASTGDDGTVRIWSLSPEPPGSPWSTILAEGTPGLNWLGFHSTFLFGSAGFRVLRWDLRMNCLKALACRVAGRGLTREEWRAATGLDSAVPDTCFQPLPSQEAAECKQVLAPYGS